MENFQDWNEQLGPVAVFASIPILFLAASIAGWYAGNWIQWLRR
jgi:hypothetical protein